MQPTPNTATARELYSRRHVLTTAGARVTIGDLRRGPNTSHYQLAIENRPTISGGSDTVLFVRINSGGNVAALAGGASGQMIQPGQTKVFDLSADLQTIWIDALGILASDGTTAAACTFQATVTEEVFSPARPNPQPREAR